MDTPELRAGVTAYFPVNVPGGMLSIGDGHARQGEGEVCGTAVEAAMNTVVVVDLVKGLGPVSPRLENDDFLMTTGSARPLEDVSRMSQHDLVGWTAPLLRLDELDVLQLVSQAGLAPVGNVVDTNYAMVGKLPKAPLGSAVAYDGLHDRLRGVDAAYLRTRRLLPRALGWRRPRRAGQRSVGRRPVLRGVARIAVRRDTGWHDARRRRHPARPRAEPRWRHDRRGGGELRGGHPGRGHRPHALGQRAVGRLAR